MMFVLGRDGIGGLGDFVRQTYINYRCALRQNGYARDKTFRREYVKACIDFRRYLKQHSANGYGFDIKNSTFIKAIRTIRQWSM